MTTTETPTADCPSAARGTTGILRVLGWLLIPAVLVALAIVLVAEVDWLKRLPGDNVARTSLVVVPDDPEAADPTRAVLTEASHDSLLASVISKLAIKDESSGRLLSPAQLRDRISFTAQCIQFIGSRGGNARGALLSFTVRGPQQAEVNAIGSAWQAALLDGGFLQDARAIASPPPYMACQGR